MAMPSEVWASPSSASVSESLFGSLLFHVWDSMQNDPATLSPQPDLLLRHLDQEV